MVRAVLKKIRTVEARFIEVGWTDDARAAAALARSAKARGFNPLKRVDQGQIRTNIYEHPETGERIRHTVGPRPQGIGGSYDHWTHETPIPGKAPGNYTHTGSGVGSDSLDQHFAKAVSKAPGTPSPKGYKGYESEVGWTDAARQAAQAVRARVVQVTQRVDKAGARLYDKTRDLIQGATKDHYAIDKVPSHAQQRINAGWPAKPEAEAAGEMFPMRGMRRGDHGSPDASGSVAFIAADGNDDDEKLTPVRDKVVQARLAAGVSGMAPVTRKGSGDGMPGMSEEELELDTAEDEHDEDVPLDSFKSDLERKKSLRQVMGKPEPDDQTSEEEGIFDELFGDNGDCDDQDKDADGRCPDDPDFDPDTAGQYGAAEEQEDPADADTDEPDTKQDKEDVNYRFSGDEKKKCGTCKFFQDPSGCSQVSGLIRPIDVCDLWKEKAAVVQARIAEAKKRAVVQAKLVSAEGIMLPPPIPKPTPPPDFDEDEKTPPGGEDVVKALKKKPNVDNPWAVAWAMKDRGEI